ncbi:hypothetical protein V3C99_008329 [Haemonchus contortus]
MLGQESLLVVQFLAILLFDSALSEACADCMTLARGQEKLLHFAVNDFTLPVQMVYSTNRKAKMQVPDIAVTKDQALRTINCHIENMMRGGIAYQITAEGLSMEVIKQIQYMPSTYEPLQCNDVAVQPAMNQVIEFDSESNGSAYNCIVTQNKLAFVCRSKNCLMSDGSSEESSTSQIPVKQNVPEKFLAYEGTLKIYNANVASWGNPTWEQILQNVEDDQAGILYEYEFEYSQFHIT